MDFSLPGFSVYGILQSGIVEWIAISFSRGSSQPGIEPTSLTSPALADRFFTTNATWETLQEEVSDFYSCTYKLRDSGSYLTTLTFSFLIPK